MLLRALGFEADFAGSLIVEYAVPAVVVGHIGLVSLTPAQIYVVAAVYALDTVAGEGDAFRAVVAEDTVVALDAGDVVDVVVADGYSIRTGPCVDGAGIHQSVLGQIREESISIVQLIVGYNTRTLFISPGLCIYTDSDAAIAEIGDGVIPDDEVVAAHLYGESHFHAQCAVGKCIVMNLRSRASHFTLHAVTHERVHAIAQEADVGRLAVHEDRAPDAAECAVRNTYGVSLGTVN